MFFIVLLELMVGSILVETAASLKFAPNRGNENGEQEHDRLDGSWAIEGAAASTFGEQVVPGADINNRRDAIMARGREQL